MNNERQQANDYPNLSEHNLEAIAAVMDDGKREQVHHELAPCSPGAFLTRYLELDPAFPVNDFDTEK